MRGKAHALLVEFRASLSGVGAPFLMSRLILMARIIPEQVTPDLDDPALEKRLAEAIAVLQAERRGGRSAK